MDLLDSANKIINECMGVKEGETVLVITDTIKENIGRVLFQAASKHSKAEESILVVIPPRTRHGEEPPSPIAKLMKCIDVIVAPTEFSLTHTQARKNATKLGVRIATLPMITLDMLTGESLGTDYIEMKRKIERLFELCRPYNKVQLKTELGTDITLEVDPEKWVKDTGLLTEKGKFGNLPAGELFIAPLEGTANGTIVIDGAMAGLGQLTSDPLKITVVDGYATEIDGGKEAKQLKTILEEARKKLDKPENVYNIAELGIGMNPGAKIIGNPLEDEKVMGTVHLALGDNSTFGGTVKAGIHLDGIITNPTLIVGPEVILDKGELREL